MEQDLAFCHSIHLLASPWGRKYVTTGPPAERMSSSITAKNNVHVRALAALLEQLRAYSSARFGNVNEYSFSDLQRRLREVSLFVSWTEQSLV